MTDTKDFAGEVEETKNKNNVFCQFCDSLILKPKIGTYCNNEVELPLMHQKNSTSKENMEIEPFADFWEVDDMFKFENIGFSHTVNNTKYLICADCEMGPVGYHDIESKKCFVALARVKHS